MPPASELRIASPWPPPPRHRAGQFPSAAIGPAVAPASSTIVEQPGLHRVVPGPRRLQAGEGFAERVCSAASASPATAARAAASRRPRQTRCRSRSASVRIRRASSSASKLASPSAAKSSPRRPAAARLLRQPRPTGSSAAIAAAYLRRPVPAGRTQRAVVRIAAEAIVPGRPERRRSSAVGAATGRHPPRSGGSLVRRQ